MTSQSSWSPSKTREPGTERRVAGCAGQLRVKLQQVHVGVAPLIDGASGQPGESSPRTRTGQPGMAA
jgi:hypothetical protein